LGNVCNGGIRKLWETSETLTAWKKTMWNDFNECGLYADCAYCNFCPGMSTLETGDLFGKSKTCCATAKVRRNVALDLRNSRDALTVYAQTHTAQFGSDVAFRPPTENIQSKRPPVIEVMPFLQRSTEIRLQGNNIRKTIVPEAGSPVDENLTKEMLAGTARFFEAGR
jgi:hypothetical protein